MKPVTVNLHLSPELPTEPGRYIVVKSTSIDMPWLNPQEVEVAYGKEGFIVYHPSVYCGYRDLKLFKDVYCFSERIVYNFN